MELGPEILLGILFGAPLILILGAGVMGAAVNYLLDYENRRAQATAGKGFQHRSVRSAAQSHSPVPSPLSSHVLSKGIPEAAPSAGLPGSKLGMWTFLASEVMFFTALIATFIGFKARGMLDAGDALNIPLTGINTFILIISSLTVVLAFEAIQKNDQNRFVLLLLGTLGLGFIFVGIQGYEWNELMHQGVTPSGSLFGTAFFVLTGFHGLHVITGLIWAVFIMLKTFRGDLSDKNHLGFELFGLYWHFVDIVWIVLFTIIYLI